MSFPMLAIDPGDEFSGYAFVDASKKYESGAPHIIATGKVDNVWLLDRLMKQTWKPALVIIEYPRPRGQPLYSQLVDTIFWIGRFVQALPTSQSTVLMDRKDVKMTLCGNVTAKDSNIRAALISMYPRNGSGKMKQIGTKKAPGPLYGVRGDAWSALALAVTQCNLMNVLS